jgi:hypothetical protein
VGVVGLKVFGLVVGELVGTLVGDLVGAWVSVTDGAAVGDTVH